MLRYFKQNKKLQVKECREQIRKERASRLYSVEVSRVNRIRAEKSKCSEEK